MNHTAKRVPEFSAAKGPHHPGNRAMSNPSGREFRTADYYLSDGLQLCQIISRRSVPALRQASKLLGVDAWSQGCSKPVARGSFENRLTSG